MAWHLRRLLEAVKEAACGLEGRWGWLGAPMALLTWFRTRRERREAAEAMQAVQGLLEAFLGLLDDFRAGRLAAEVQQGADGAVAHPSPSRKGRGVACEVAGEEEALTEDVAPSCSSASSAVKPAARWVGAGTQWIPAFAGMTGTGAGAMGFFRWIDSRAPPDGCFSKNGEADSGDSCEDYVSIS
jgi:hypothetical protein